MKRILTLVLALAMVLSLAACGGSKEAAEGEESSAAEVPADYDPTQGDKITIKVGTPHYEQSVGYRSLVAMGEWLEEKTAGRVTVEVLGGGVLGNASNMMDMLYNNDIQMDVINPSVVEKQVPALCLLQRYYAFDDLDHVHRFFEGEGGQMIYDAWNDIGLQGMGLFSLGFRELYNSKRPIKTMDDLKGLSIRGYSTIQIATWKSVGVDAVSIDWNELFVSLQQKLIDGEEGAIVNFEDFSFYEVQPYFTLTDHVFGCDIPVCSMDWLDSLSAGDRALIEEACEYASQYHKEHYIPENEALLKKFSEEYGVEVDELDPEVKAQMAETMGEASAKLVIEIVGQEKYDEFMALVDAARA